MSRKRPPSPPPSPPPKRHLNSALAAELQSLRISNHTHPETSSRNAFGTARSPFLSHPSRNTRPPSSNVAFGADFAQNLQQAPDVPVVTSPEPEPQDMAIETDDNTTVYQSASEDLVIEECEDEDSPTENRLIVYRPPVKMTAESLARLNARLPDGQFVLRNSRTDEWIMTETQNERLKRKLALVPWTGDAKRKLYDPAAAQSRVIPMPWHDTPKAQDTQDDFNTQATVSNAEQIMEIDEVNDVP